jgi:hypothetical protein
MKFFLILYKFILFYLLKAIEKPTSSCVTLNGSANNENSAYQVNIKPQISSEIS